MAKLTNSFAMAGTAALAMTLGACQRDVKPVHDSASIKAAIAADEKAWQQDLKRRDLDGLASHYADDAVFASSAGPAAKGSTEIRRFFATALADKNFQVSFASDKMDVAASGDLAYSRGHFSEQYTDPKTGKVMSQSGSYMEVFKRQPDGRWKMVGDFAAGDPSTVKEVPPTKPATRATMVSF